MESGDGTLCHMNQNKDYSLALQRLERSEREQAAASGEP
jgi:hypothetical protein